MSEQKALSSWGSIGAAIGVTVGAMDGLKAIGPGDISEVRIASTLLVATVLYGVIGLVGLPLFTKVLGASGPDTGSKPTFTNWVHLTARSLTACLLVASVGILSDWVTRPLFPPSEWKDRVILLMLIIGLAGVGGLRLVRRLFPGRGRTFAMLGVALFFSLTVAGATAFREQGPAAAVYRQLSSSPDSSPRQDARPNTLLVVLDTTRADHLSPYEYTRDTTPFLNALARESTVYENAIAPAPWTLPSHASIFTGLPPAIHQAIRQHRWLDPAFTTLAEALAANGYSTVGLSSNSWVGPPFNLSQGFEEYFEIYQLVSRDPADPLSRLALGGLATLLLGERIPPDKGAKALNEAATLWLETHLRKDGDRPFFMFVNYMEAHLPYLPPPGLRHRFLSKPLSPRLQFLMEENWWLHDKTFELLGRKETLDADDYAQLAALYDGSLAYLDACLRELIGAFERRGLLEKTLVIITADHGENLGEHDGLVSHIFSLHQSLLHVPLIVRYPAAAQAKGGRYGGMVPLQAVFPTVLSVAGLEPPAGWPGDVSPLPRAADEHGGLADTAEPVDGSSEDGAGSTGSPGRPLIVSEDDLPVDELSRLTMSHPGNDVRSLAVARRAIQDGEWKLVEDSDGHSELFDLAADPGEKQPFEPQNLEAGRRLEQALRSWEAELEVPHLSGSSTSRGVDQSTLDALKAMGYVE